VTENKQATIDSTISSERIMSTLREQLSAINATVDRQEASVVTQVGDGIAYISGLKTAMAGELLQFTSSVTGRSVYGLAQNLEEDRVGAVLFGDVDSIKEGDECRTTGRVMDIPVGHAMLGRVVNPLGQPIDGLGPIASTHRRPIEFKAPGIMARQPVCEPVLTGLLAIDAMVPIGRGQRELIIGDRKTGKTAIAIDTIVNQRDTDMLCIYVAIGQKASTVATIRESLASTASSTRRSLLPPPPRTPHRCSTSLLWPARPLASTSCTTTPTATPQTPRTPVPTFSWSMTTSPSRPWPTVRCR
jgi:F-type H+-transporting ATPase subunit alpha